jgi:hypothetical protein
VIVESVLVHQCLVVKYSASRLSFTMTMSSFFGATKSWWSMQGGGIENANWHAHIRLHKIFPFLNRVQQLGILLRGILKVSTLYFLLNTRWEVKNTMLLVYPFNSPMKKLNKMFLLQLKDLLQFVIASSFELWNCHYNCIRLNKTYFKTTSFFPPKHLYGHEKKDVYGHFHVIFWIM